MGDKIEVQGVFQRPAAADPAHLQGEQIILKLNATPTAIKVIEPSKITITTPASPFVTQQIESAAARYKLKIKPGGLQVPGTDYAVLINGGYNMANYWVSFYNDLIIDYKMLLGRGYEPPANITVINANGDGLISMAETYNYTRVHIDACGPQIPRYNDDGAMPDTTGLLPQGTEGLLGAGVGL